MRQTVLGVLILAMGCGEGGGSSGGSGVESGVVALAVENQPDHFVLSGGAAVYSAVKSYSWSCSEDQANITIDDGISFGSIGIEVVDAAGSLVYENTYPAVLGGAISAVTRPGGVAGLWTIQLTFTSATWGGDIAFDADTANLPDVLLHEGGYVTSATFFYQAEWPMGSVQLEIKDGLAVGAIRIQVWDPSGVLKYDQVFVGPMGNDILHTTALGTAGTWSVQIDLINTVNGGAIALSSS